MSKTPYSAAMSLDGFIAGAGGDISWSSTYLGPNPEVDEFTGKIGALLASAGAPSAATIRTRKRTTRARRLADRGAGHSSC